MKGWKYFGSLMAPLSSATYPRNCLSLDFLLGEQSKLYLFKQIFIEYFIYRKKGIRFNNFSLSYGISILIGIVSYLIIYLPIDHFFGHNMIVSIALLFFDYVLISYISYSILNTRKIKYSNIIGTLLIVFIYFIFYYITYYPVHSYIFYDTKDKVYGIKKED